MPQQHSWTLTPALVLALPLRRGKSPHGCVWGAHHLCMVGFRVRRPHLRHGLFMCPQRHRQLLRDMQSLPCERIHKHRRAGESRHGGVPEHNTRTRNSSSTHTTYVHAHTRAHTTQHTHTTQDTRAQHTCAHTHVHTRTHTRTQHTRTHTHTQHTHTHTHTSLNAKRRRHRSRVCLTHPFARVTIRSNGWLS